MRAKKFCAVLAVSLASQFSFCPVSGAETI